MTVDTICCPECGSDNVQRYSVAYQSGVSDVTSNTVGVGFNGKVGVGAAQTNSVSVSAMAASTAPPEKKSVIKTFLIFGFLSVILQVLIKEILPNFLGFISIVAYLLGPYMAYSNYKWNNEVWPELRDEWERSWVCLKCNHRFIK